MQYLWTHHLRKCTLPIKVDCPQKEYPLPRGILESFDGIICILVWMSQPGVHSAFQASHVTPWRSSSELARGVCQGFFQWLPVVPKCLNRATDQLVDSSLSSPCFLFPLLLDVFLAVFFASSPTFWVAKEGEIQTVARWTRRETVTVDRNDAFASL